MSQIAYPPAQSGTREEAGTQPVLIDPVTVLIDPEALMALISAGAPVTVLDVRWRLSGPPSRDDFRRGHVPGARFVDLDADLAGIPGPDGRHPLPLAAELGTAMRRCGVSAGRAVVCYDERDSTSAARCWWTLRYFGHRAVSVLDGGIEAWRRAGGPIEAGEEGDAPVGDFEPDPSHLPIVDAGGAARIARSPAGVLLDARAAERYRGEVEPLDPVAGHIPGAVSAPTLDNVDATGRWRRAGELRSRFRSLGLDGGQIEAGVYCGSGVTAAHEVLAISLAGLGTAALYVGSWSEWSQDPSRPVATGEDPG